MKVGPEKLGRGRDGRNSAADKRRRSRKQMEVKLRKTGQRMNFKINRERSKKKAQHNKN